MSFEVGTFAAFELAVPAAGNVSGAKTFNGVVGVDGAGAVVWAYHMDGAEAWDFLPRDAGGGVLLVGKADARTFEADRNGTLARWHANSELREVDFWAGRARGDATSTRASSRGFESARRRSVERSTRGRDSSKHEPNRLRCDRARAARRLGWVDPARRPRAAQVDFLGSLRRRSEVACTGRNRNYNQASHECRVDRRAPGLPAWTTQYEARRGARRARGRRGGGRRPPGAGPLLRRRARARRRLPRRARARGARERLRRRAALAPGPAPEGGARRGAAVGRAARARLTGWDRASGALEPVYDMRGAAPRAAPRRADGPCARAQVRPRVAGGRAVPIDDVVDDVGVLQRRRRRPRVAPPDFRLPPRRRGRGAAPGPRRAAAPRAPAARGPAHRPRPAQVSLGASGDLVVSSRTLNTVWALRHDGSGPRWALSSSLARGRKQRSPPDVDVRAFGRW